MIEREPLTTFIGGLTFSMLSLTSTVLLSTRAVLSFTLRVRRCTFNLL